MPPMMFSDAESDRDEDGQLNPIVSDLHGAQDSDDDVDGAQPQLGEVDLSNVLGEKKGKAKSSTPAGGKSSGRKSMTSVVRMDDDDEDVKEDVAHLDGAGPASGRKRGRPSLKGASKDDAEEPPAKKRGRPAKAASSAAGPGRPARTPNKAAPVKRSARPAPSATSASNRPSRKAAKSAMTRISEQKKPQYSSVPVPAATTRKRGVAAGKKAAPVKKTAAAKKTAPVEEYVVEKIIESKTDRQGKESYHVKWKGYDAEDNTWEPAANLNHCPKLLQEFRSRKS